MPSKTDKQTSKTKAKASPKRGSATSSALDAPVEITATEPAKEAESNGRIVGRLANYKQRRGRKRFTKQEQEIIDLWRAIFAAMEKEEEKAKA